MHCVDELCAVQSVGSGKDAAREQTELHQTSDCFVLGRLGGARREPSGALSLQASHYSGHVLLLTTPLVLINRTLYKYSSYLVPTVVTLGLTLFWWFFSFLLFFLGKIVAYILSQVTNYIYSKSSVQSSTGWSPVVRLKLMDARQVNNLRDLCGNVCYRLW